MKKIVIALLSLVMITTAYAQVEKQQYDKAIARLREAKSELERFYALDRAAKASVNIGNKQEAKQLAEELQGLMQKYRDDWNYGNVVQDVNIVLGRIAVSEGRIEDAKKHLLEAGKSPGSPQMDSFGPNMTLAKDLLEKGEKDVVIQYFELCSKFWEMDSGKLKQWTQQVRDGQIPDFGPNLLY